MSYQVIARKWRPQTFDEVTGQEIITHTLRNAIEHDRLHHAYLFSGARGVGKTTTARILAKSLNCHKTDGPNLTPCLLTDPEICPSCLEISESRSMDVLEIDAASHTGIDDVRETIIENINFNPARDRYKVFIIDEVHQLSKPAFNALLKTLEEPPGNVVFVMATTELHKVPDTILSRCQEFQFRTIPLPKIFDRLRLIADAEKIDISDEALRELARSGEGSMRDAQSNFDQVISFSGEKITPADVTSALGFAGLDVLRRSIGAIAERQPLEALKVVDDLISGGNDLRNFCRDLLGLFRDLLVFKVAADDQHLIEGSVFAPDEMNTMGGAFTEADLLRSFNSLCETEMRLRDAVHPRYVLEVGLVKLIEMRTVTSIESLIERFDAIVENRPMPEVTTAERAAAMPTPPPKASPAPDAEKKTLNFEREPDRSRSTPKTGPESSDLATPAARDLAPYDENFDEPAHLAAGFDHFADDTEPFAPAVPEKVPAFEPPVLPPAYLPPLTSEELAHFEDPRWDDAYEERLLLTGDNLKPISTADTLIRMLFGASEPQPIVRAEPMAVTAAAAKPAFDVERFKAEITPPEPDIPLPELGPDPTSDELQHYARAHPAVRSAIRVFRARIVEVSAD